MLRSLIAVILLMLLCSTTASAQDRETLFDRIVHLEPSVITEIPATPRLEVSLGIAGRKISVGDAELWVEEEGSGIPLVLINGGPGGTHHMFHLHRSGEPVHSHPGNCCHISIQVICTGDPISLPTGALSEFISKCICCSTEHTNHSLVA